VAAYKAVLAKFVALQTQVSLMKRQSAYNKASIDISDESILSAGVTDQIVTGTYNLRVTSLARNHQIACQGFDEATSTIFGTGTISLSVGEAGLTTINIESGNNSLVGIKEAINEANVGITATIINDGSSSRPYRLMLTANKTGAANDINFEISLTGGETLDFINSSFDNPEVISFSTGSTSQLSLGTTASYSGNTNKIYTFAVGGTGTQTIGTDNITINWTDGTNSGSILVTEADAEYELIGAGGEGLKLSFSAGDLVAGDTFQVSAFAPLIQEAADARITVGAESSENGSPIIINSETNEFKDALPGLTINVKKVNNPGEFVTITSDVDSDALKGLVDDFISKFNDVIDFINGQFTYNQDTGESGVLFADYSLQVMQSTARSAATFVVGGLQNEINSLSSIGIRTGQNGRLRIVNSARLIDTIKNDTEDFIKLFVDSAVSSSPFIEFVSASSETVPGEDYEINITRAAAKGYYQGASLNNPATAPITLNDTNNVIKLNVDGLMSDELVLAERTYNSGEELAGEIQTRINADAKLAGKGISVEWVELPEGGYIKIVSGSYGARSRVQLVTSIADNAYSILGLTSGMVRVGEDVEGTINGEKATGNGQILTGDEGNATTDGLKIKVMLTAGQLQSGEEGVISIIKGLGSKLDETLGNITKSIDGSIARRTSALSKQIEAIDRQISNYEERLTRRREYLYNQFLAMEEALGRYQAQGTYLESQLENLQNNWNLIFGQK
jgi:flagellar hook-associated protein 2